jgi:cation transport ATPase
MFRFGSFIFILIGKRTMTSPLNSHDELKSSAAISDKSRESSGSAAERPWYLRIQGLLMIAASAILFSIMSMLVNVSGARFATFQITAIRFAVQTTCAGSFAVYAKGWNVLKWAPAHQHKFLMSRAVFGTLAVSHARMLRLVSPPEIIAENDV